MNEIFVNCLGAKPDNVVRTIPLPDFGGAHPDPNLTYAKELVDAVRNGDYDLGAAFDGDGVRSNESVKWRPTKVLIRLYRTVT